MKKVIQITIVETGEWGSLLGESLREKIMNITQLKVGNGDHFWAKASY